MSRRPIGPIRTLADACEVRRLLWALCRACGHAARLDPRELVRTGARDVDLDQLARRLKCRRCGAARGAIVLDDRPAVGRD